MSTARGVLLPSCCDQPMLRAIGWGKTVCSSHYSCDASALDTRSPEDDERAPDCPDEFPALWRCLSRRQHTSCRLRPCCSSSLSILGYLELCLPHLVRCWQPSRLCSQSLLPSAYPFRKCHPEPRVHGINSNPTCNLILICHDNVQMYCYSLSLSLSLTMRFWARKNHACFEGLLRSLRWLSLLSCLWWWLPRLHLLGTELPPLAESGRCHRKAASGPKALPAPIKREIQAASNHVMKSLT